MLYTCKLSLCYINKAQRFKQKYASLGVFGFGGLEWRNGMELWNDREPVSALISMVSPAHNSRLKSQSYCKPCKQQLGHPNNMGVHA